MAAFEIFSSSYRNGATLDLHKSGYAHPLKQWIIYDEAEDGEDYFFTNPEQTVAIIKRVAKNLNYKLLGDFGDTDGNSFFFSVEKETEFNPEAFVGAIGEELKQQNCFPVILQKG